MGRLDDIQAFDQYLRRRSPDRRTPVDYVSDVRQFAAACDKPWREVTMHDVDSFVDQQRQAGRSPATVKRRVAALKVFFDFLAEESGDLAWPNPVRSKRHAGKQPQRLPRDLSNEAVERLWSTITGPRDRAWFVLMWCAGLRCGEVVALRLDDVLAAPQGEQPARLRVCGKGRKERIVLLTADAYAVVEVWLCVRPTSATPYVFLNERGQPLTVNGIEWLLRRYGAQVGVPLTPHQLRHTFARQVTEAGMPLTSLSKLLGHAQVSTTEIYTAGADPALAQAYQAAMAHAASPALAQPAPTPATAVPATAVAVLHPAPPPDLAAWAPDLPLALREACLALVRRRLPTWKPQRRRVRANELLCKLASFWRWQLARRPLTQLAELTLSDLRAYQETAHGRGMANSTINRVLSCVMALLHSQADQDQPVAAGVFRLRPLLRPDSLPRHLTPTESQTLDAYVACRLTTSDPAQQLINACYFVLAHSGLRASECLDVQGQDLDLAGQRLLVRQGKGQRDRVVYLSAFAGQALTAYLQGQRPAPAAPLWTQPDGQPLTYQWLYRHLLALGQAAGVAAVSPHRLRHTLATRLLNAGMDITRIQKLLGHAHVTTTQIYARVFDATVEADYRQAMAQIARHQLPLSDAPIPVVDWPIRPDLGSAEALAPAQAALDNSV